MQHRNQENKGHQVIKSLQDFLHSLGIKKKSPDIIGGKNIDVYRSTPDWHNINRKEKFIKFIDDVSTPHAQTPISSSKQLGFRNKRKLRDVNSVNFNKLAGADILTFVPKACSPSPENKSQRMHSLEKNSMKWYRTQSENLATLTNQK